MLASQRWNLPDAEKGLCQLMDIPAGLAFRFFLAVVDDDELFLTHGIGQAR